MAADENRSTATKLMVSRGHRESNHHVWIWNDTCPFAMPDAAQGSMSARLAGPESFYGDSGSSRRRTHDGGHPRTGAVKGRQDWQLVRTLASRHGVHGVRP